MLQEEKVCEILEQVICEPSLDTNVRQIGHKVVTLVHTSSQRNATPVPSTQSPWKPHQQLLQQP